MVSYSINKVCDDRMNVLTYLYCIYLFFVLSCWHISSVYQFYYSRRSCFTRLARDKHTHHALNRGLDYIFVFFLLLVKSLWILTVASAKETKLSNKNKQLELYIYTAPEAAPATAAFFAAPAYIQRTYTQYNFSDLSVKAQHSANITYIRRQRSMCALLCHST